MLRAIQENLGNRVSSTWADDMTTWGEQVALYRDYADGNHRAELTSEMKALLRISGDQTDQFNLNYCDMVVQAMSDRLTVSSIDGDTDESSVWGGEVRESNRFDGLQMDVHEAAVRDGDTFLMVEYDNDKQMATLTHEPAWDGEVGMMVVYDRMRKTIVAAVKVWAEAGLSGDDVDDVKRVNIYYPDKAEKYITEESGQDLKPFEDDDTDENGVVTWKAKVVPVIHFRNRSRSRTTRGISELAGVVPPQDALNRTLVSMVMTAELTGFPIRVALGFDPPANLSPGMWVAIGADGLTKDQVADAKTMEAAQLVPFINQAQFLIEQIGLISRTPLPNMMGGDSQSGEALKQREIGLLGKVSKFQVKGGNSWEDMMAMAHLMQDTFGNKNPPAVKRWSAKWKDAQIRNDTEVIQNAKAVRDEVGEKEFLRLISAVYGYDDAKIAELLEEKSAEAASRLSALMSPGFENFKAN